MKTKKGKMGAPPKYQEDFARMAEVACHDGATDKKLAELFGVCERTVNNWKRKHLDFLQSTQRGKDEFDSNIVEYALKKISLGIHYTETTREARGENGELVVTKKVRKFIPPNDRAIRFWLKNRQPNRWRDTQAVEVTGKEGGPVQQELTNFPCGPLTLAEWEQQVKELNEQNKADNQPDTGDTDGLLGTTSRTPA
jgi:hypothetical protein